MNMSRMQIFILNIMFKFCIMVIGFIGVFFAGYLLGAVLSISRNDEYLLYFVLIMVGILFSVYISKPSIMFFYK